MLKGCHDTHMTYNWVMCWTDFVRTSHYLWDVCFVTRFSLLSSLCFIHFKVFNFLQHQFVFCCLVLFLVLMFMSRYYVTFAFMSYFFVIIWICHCYSLLSNIDFSQFQSLWFHQHNYYKNGCCHHHIISITIIIVITTIGKGKNSVAQFLWRWYSGASSEENCPPWPMWFWQMQLYLTEMSRTENGGR